MELHRQPGGGTNVPLPKRPRDSNQLAKLVVDMATGDVPNDKDEILDPTAPSGRANSAKARAISQTPERRREVAQKAAAARWGTKDGALNAVYGS